MRSHPPSTLFPYTTLFRSGRLRLRLGRGQRHVGGNPDFFVHLALDGLDLGLGGYAVRDRSEEHTSELQSLTKLVCRLLLEKKNKNHDTTDAYRTRSRRTPK